MDEARIGSKRTKQREAILRVLSSTNSHPDARWVYEQVRQQLPRVSLGTIYRNLDLLARSGLVRQLHANQGYSRYDSDTAHHAHIACRVCGRLWDVPVDPEEGRLRQWADRAGFREVALRIDLEGVCADCAAQGAG